MCLMVWRDELFHSLKQHLFDGIMNLVVRDRNGEAINTGLIRQMTTCLVDLGLQEDDDAESSEQMGQLAVYKEHFEKAFLDKTEEFYVAESDAFLEQNPVTEYMKKAETRLDEEMHRVHTYLHESTRDALAVRCEDVLIKRHVEKLHGEFQKLLDDERIDDLKRMYKLLKTIKDGHVELRLLLEKHVVAQGLLAIEKAIGDDAKNPDATAYVKSMLATHKNYSGMVETAFDNDSSFKAALDKACRQFVNRNAVTKAASKSASDHATAKSPELLAKYCDGLLKKSSKDVGSDDVEQLLDGVMVVFRYLEDNDVFQKFYSRGLAHRLVKSNSASDDAEASMISKLKQTCGYEWTQKFQRMFQNMATSKELMVKFKKTEISKKVGVKDLEVKVLTHGSWPFQVSEPFTFPIDLQRGCQLFEQFYLSEHQGRKLTWLPLLSRGEIVTNFTKDPKSGRPMSYTLIASAYQMSILLQFNDRDSMSVEDMATTLGSSAKDLKGSLGIMEKAKLLVPSEEGTNYTLNEGFKNKKIKVNINIPIKSKDSEEADNVHESINEDRKMVIQASLVRIMKTRKRMKHGELMTAAIDQLKSRFKPKPQAIKTQIGALIEKDFLERVEGTRDEYNYLA
jgi:cullin 1